MTEAKAHNAEHELLIVEDSAIQAKLLERVLKRQGYSVALASNGLEGLDMARALKPSLVISDINMPAMGGYELCQKIKFSKDLQDTPVVLLTELSDPDDIIRGLQARADQYVTKPFDEEHLLAVVRSLLRDAPVDGEADRFGKNLEATLSSVRRMITADHERIVNILLATYKNAVQQKNNVVKAQKELKALNEQLEAKVQQRTQALQDALEELEALSLNDELTGLYNRRGFSTVAEQQLKLNQRRKERSALLFCDLDGLKHINDTLGHKQGDRAIAEAADALKRTFRDSDVIARLGGDEFVVLLADAAEPEIEQAIARLEHHVAQLNASERAYRLSLSVGVATSANGAQGLDDLVAQADELMYEQKKRKRTSR